VKKKKLINAIDNAMLTIFSLSMTD